MTSWNVLKSQPFPIIRTTFFGFFLPFLAMIPLHLLMGAVLFLFGDPPPVWAAVVAGIIGVIELILLIGLSFYGLLVQQWMFLKAVRGQPLTMWWESPPNFAGALGIMGWWLGRSLLLCAIIVLLMLPAILTMDPQSQEPPWILLVVIPVVLLVSLVFNAWFFYKFYGETTAFLIATDEGLSGGEAMAESERRMDGSKLNLFFSIMLTWTVPGSVIGLIHMMTCGLAFPVVFVGQFGMMAMIYTQLALVYEAQRGRGRKGRREGEGAERSA
jgi:hypothetical protein